MRKSPQIISFAGERLTAEEFGQLHPVSATRYDALLQPSQLLGLSCPLSVLVVKSANSGVLS